MPARLTRTFEQMCEAARHAAPRTPGEMTVLADGRRLDTPEKVRAWVDEVNAERAAEQAAAAVDGTAT